MMAMELWGKWYHEDIDAQLGTSWRSGPSLARPAAAAAEPGSTQGASLPLGFDANSWLRVCGVPCVVANCISARPKDTPPLQLCHQWVNKGAWYTRKLLDEFGSRPRAAGANERRATLEELERAAIRAVARHVRLPPALETATASAATSHPRGLIAFATPIAAADRREYQLYVHVLMSAAMLTQRKPVLPLALCGQTGEWSARSRCIYVMHAAQPNGAQYCVMRPPSPCHGKVALPNELEGVDADHLATVPLPRLSLLNGTVDVVALGRALGAQGRDRRILLIHPGNLASADDLSSLLATPKGWLCTLEHKSCQSAC